MTTLDLGVPRGWRCTGASFLIAAVLLLCAFIVLLLACLNSEGTGYVVASPVREHPVLSGGGFVALVTTAIVAFRSKRLAAMCAAGWAVGLISVGLVGWALNSAWSKRQAQSVSPDGRYALVVQPWSRAIDPMWSFQLRTREGMISRYWRLGCIDGDLDDFRGVRWVSASEVVVKARSGEKRIVLGASGPRSVDASLRDCAAHS